MATTGAEKSGGVERVLKDLRAHQLELEIQNQELQAVQAELEVVLKRYRDLFDRAPVGYLTLDPKGTIRQANLTAAVLLGRDRKVLEGESLASLVHPEDQDRFFLQVRRRLSREAVGSTELRILDGTGEYFFAGLDFSVEEDPGGEGFRTWCTLADLTERKAAQDALAESRNRLRVLASRLQEIREEERTRLARELHDVIGQSLAALAMDLGWLSQEMGQARGEVGETIRRMRSLIVELIGQVTEHVISLRPPELDILGLSPAMGNELARLGQREGLTVSSKLSFQRLLGDASFQTQVLRIFEEAISNVLRHADAQALRVSFEEESGVLVLEVEDDGVGISDELIQGPRSFGLMSMRERAASVGGVVSTTRGTMGGTLVRATFPLPHDADS